MELRFLSKITTGSDTECWNWGGNICPSTHYGRFSIKGKYTGAHRISYEIFVGPLTKGMFIDHICRNRKCVNPEHLRQVTPRINSIENSTGGSARNAVKTHCKNGHELIGENLVICSNLTLGTEFRNCRICQKELKRDWSIRNREKRNAYYRNKRKLSRDSGEVE